MSKSFSQAPKPQQLTAEVISAFERRGAGQDTRARIPSNAENRDPTNVGDVAPELAGPDLQPTDVERGEPTKVETVKASKLGLGIPTKEGTAERTRRLSIDLPESWHQGRQKNDRRSYGIHQASHARARERVTPRRDQCRPCSSSVMPAGSFPLLRSGLFVGSAVFFVFVLSVPDKAV